MKVIVASLLFLLYVKGDVQISVTYGQEPSHHCLHDNDDITVTCTVNPLSNVVEWLHDATRIAICSNTDNDLCLPYGETNPRQTYSSLVSNGEFTLRINPVSPDTDAGVYTCEHGGPSDSATLAACAQVISAHLQKNGVTINSGPLEVNVSDSTTLDCRVLPSNSKPAPTIVWYIGSVKKQESISTSYTFTPSETDHDKIIYCEAYNLQSASNAVVSAKPKLYVKVPVSTVQLKKDNQAFNGAILTVTAGRTINLSCTPGFSRPSPPTIDWYIGLAPKISDSVQYRYTAEANDHGREIFCQAYIPQQTIKAESNKPTLNINVLVTTVTLEYQSNTPSSSDRVTVTAGTATRFTCTASFSRPQATIDWYIEGYDTPKQSSTSPTFDLTATEADHNRRIYCKAYNNIQTEAQGILSEKPMLYVQVKVASATMKYQGNTPSTVDTVTVTAGRAAAFTCITSTSRPQATIDWYIQGSHSTLRKQRSTSSTYDLNATDADHSKRIYCKAYNIQTEAQGVLSEKPMLYVQVQVSTVTLKHNNQQPVTEGQIEVTAGVPERLICELGHSRPTPTIDWYIKDDTNRKQRSTVSTYDLDANNEDHDKVIYCKAYNLQGAANGVVSTKPKLYVRVLAAIPSFLNSSTNGFILLNGDTYTIQCQSTPTRPAAVIAWKIMNVPLTTTKTREVTESRGLVSVISTLSLYAQRSYHESEIICESKITEQHTIPETKASLIIWWRPSKPSVLTFNNDFPWVEGLQGQLTCYYTDNGNPPAMIKWTPNIGTMNTENRLVIDSLSYMDHRRLVKCRVVNEFTEEKNEIIESDEISLNVQFSPKFLTTEGVFVGKFQENVSITFLIYSNPEEVIPKLFVNGSEINNNEKYVVNKESVSEMFNLTITIVSLEEGDFADYMLDVTNSVDTTAINFTVRAESIPSAPTSFSLRELRGSVAIFYWERGFNGGHKQHFLLQLRSDTEDSWSNRTIVEEHDVNSNLGNTSYIANISGLNPGIYRVRLVAVNSIGAAEPVLLETTFTILSTVEDEANNSVAAIVGGVSAGVLVIIVIVAAVFIIKYLRQKGFLTKKKNESLKTANYEDLSQIRGNSSTYDNIGTSIHDGHDSRNEESTYEGLKSNTTTEQAYSSLIHGQQTNSETKDPIYTNLKLN